MTIEDLVNGIGTLDEVAMQTARLRQQVLTKPAGSLGRLEDLSVQIAGITAQALPQTRVYGNPCDGVKMWWCFAGGTRKTPPHVGFTTEFPKEPQIKHKVVTVMAGDHGVASEFEGAGISKGAGE